MSAIVNINPPPKALRFRTESVPLVSLTKLHKMLGFVSAYIETPFCRMPDSKTAPYEATTRFARTGPFFHEPQS